MARPGPETQQKQGSRSGSLPPSAAPSAGGTAASVSPAGWSAPSSAGPGCAAGTSSPLPVLLWSAGGQEATGPGGQTGAGQLTLEERARAAAHLLLQDGLVLLGQLVSLSGEAVPLVLQLLVQLQLVLVHLRLQLVLQAHQLLLMLPPHALVARHLLAQRRALLVLLDLPGHLQDRQGGDPQGSRIKLRTRTSSG